jgi:PTH2 family peptidyl-tRNA hydrolase
VDAYPVKQVIAVRKDLNMRKGKIAAQVAHAAMLFLREAMQSVSVTANGNVMYEFPLSIKQADWLDNSFTKIVVYVNSLDELLAIHREAAGLGLASHLMIDNGATEFHGVPTATCVAIGPDSPDKLDPITGHLPLL